MPKFQNPNLNDEGYNTRTGAVHCCKAGCEKPLFDRYHVFADHVFTVWEHYAASGLDGVLERVNRQTSVMYDAEHSPFIGKDGKPVAPNTRACISCGKDVDRAKGRSEVDVTLVKTDGSRTALGHFRVHPEHLPAEFDVVAQEAKKISSAAPAPAAALASAKSSPAT